MYMAPILSAWSYFPRNKGMCTGIIAGAMGLGGAIFNLIATALVNPHNEHTTIKEHQGGVTNHYYDYGVTYRVPAMLRWLTLMWLVLLLIGFVLIQDLREKSNISIISAIDPNEVSSVKVGLKDRRFKLLCIMGFLTVALGLYCAGAYKSIEESEIDNDQLLAIVGSVSNIANGCFRFVFGYL